MNCCVLKYFIVNSFQYQLSRGGEGGGLTGVWCLLLHVEPGDFLLEPKLPVGHGPLFLGHELPKDSLCSFHCPLEVASETESTVDSEFSRTQFEDLVPSPTSEKSFLAQIHARKPGYIHGGATSTMHGDM